MRRGRLVLVMGLLIALSVVIGLLLFTSPSPAINRVTYAAIQGGMTEREVADLFGVRAGDYRTGDVLYDGAKATDEAFGGNVTLSREWLGDEGMVQVGFDAEGRVVGKTFVVVGRSSHNPLARLRRVFRW